MSRFNRWIQIAAAGTTLLVGTGLSVAEARAAQPDTAPQQAAAPAAAITDGGTIHGTVKSGPVPLPGVAITATSSVTGKKFATTTDVDGNYSMTVPKDGTYVVKAELAAFAAVTHEVQMTASAGDQSAEFALQLASRVPITPPVGAASTTAATSGTTTPRQRPAGAAGGGFGGAGGGYPGRTRTLQGRGTQTLGDGESADAGTLDATTGGVNVAMPTIGGIDSSATGDPSEAITISGNAGVTNGLANLNEDQLRQQIQGAQDNIRAQGGNPQDQMNGVVSLLGNIQAGGAGLFGVGGGGPGGPGGGPGGRGGGGGGGQRGGGGGGGFRNFNPAQPHGSIFYQGSNSALNSAPWSPSLDPLTNPSSYSNRFGVSITGTPYIPHLTKPDARQFVFINLTGQKNLNAFLPNPVRVPTLLEREGIFTSSEQEVNGALAPVNIFNPYTGTKFTNNTIPACTTAGQTGCITPQAQALLNQYYPLPNINTLSTDPTVYNYQTVSNAGSNNVAINARYQRQLGQAQAPGQRGGARGGPGGGRGQRPNPNAPPVLRQNINAQYAYSHSASDNRNIFLPLGGATESDGNSLNVGYVASYGRLSDNASLNWNRSSGETRNYFTDTNNNPSATVGICVPNGSGNSACGAGPATISDPRFYNGLPSISITNFQGLSNQTPSKTVNQTIAFSDFVSWRHKKHNFRFGGDIRRVHADSIGGNNPLGQYQFTGYATESPSDQVDANGTATTGSGFADFLLGLPVSTKIQAGLNKIYLRENVYDWYAQDDWRLKTNFTINAGLRYEYFAPYTEKFNHLANIDHNSTFTAVDVVTPGQTGTFGGSYNRGLVNPDYTMYAPRIGIAWSPKSKWTKNVVIRGGYGTNFNTGQFATAAKSLSFQPPFAQTQTNAATVATVGNPTPTTSGCTTQSANTIMPTTANFTLANGFIKNGNTSGCSTGNPIHNSFSIDKDYRLGMVQIFNLNIQKSIGPAIVVNVGYNGSKASHLDITGSPTSIPTGNTLAGTASPFTYETSVAGLHSNQLAVSITQRQKKGVALGLTYAYSHSIDNASSVGGGSGSTVQNFYRLDLEEANSSFDQRHLLNGTWLLELPFGPNREFLNKGGAMAKLLDGFNLSGTITVGSGSYFTPQYSGSTSEALSGNNYTQRPNRVFTQSTVGSGKLKSFFNTAAFTAPTVVNGITQFGTASRNSIEGPGTLATTAALSRTVQMSGTNSVEVRITASNVFNTVQYSGINTTVNSQTYGQVTSAAAMRAVQFLARYRF